VNADGFGRLKVERNNGYESFSSTLQIFFFTEKRKRPGSKGRRKIARKHEKISAFKSAGSDKFHIGPCRRIHITNPG